MSAKLLFWTTVAVTLAVYAAMVFWSIPAITREAGGLPVFDMRPGGYSYEEAKAFLAALSPDGAQFYANVQHGLDTAYPALLGITLGWAILRLSPARWSLWRWLLAATAIPGMIFDYWENHDVAQMLVSGPDNVTPEFVAAASFHSQAKAVSTTVCATIVLILLALWAFRRWRASHNPL